MAGISAVTVGQRVEDVCYHQYSPEGLFQFTGFPYGVPCGVSSTPDIFQRVIENVLQGLTGVANSAQYHHHRRGAPQDTRGGIEVSGKSLSAGQDEEMQVYATIHHLYLGHMIDGHMIDKQGVHPLSDKMQAIQDAQSHGRSQN